jgi:hypothetical protein
VVDFIKENFIIGRSDVMIDPDVSFIESSIMDSTGVMELVEYLSTARCYPMNIMACLPAASFRDIIQSNGKSLTAGSILVMHFIPFPEDGP